MEIGVFIKLLVNLSSSADAQQVHTCCLPKYGYHVVGECDINSELLHTLFDGVRLCISIFDTPEDWET